jgi:hypothetical protein
MRTIFLPALLACLFCATTASALDMPQRKSGLWEIKTASDGTPAQAIQQCVDQQSDNLMAQRAGAMGKDACSKNDVRREGNAIMVNSVCKFGNSVATTSGVFSGSFESAYQGKMKTSYSPPLYGKAESNTAIEARWVGPCKPGQKPGDMVMPGMGNINLNELMKNLPK